MAENDLFFYLSMDIYRFRSVSFQKFACFSLIDFYYYCYFYFLASLDWFIFFIYFFISYVFPSSPGIFWAIGLVIGIFGLGFEKHQ